MREREEERMPRRVAAEAGFGAGTRHALWATPPSATRASVITPSSSFNAAATDTSANAYDRRSRSFRYE